MPEHLIDAFNVFHADPRLERVLMSGGPLMACRELARLLRAWIKANRGEHTATVVLDGGRPLAAGPPGAAEDGLTIIYAHGDADTELKRRLATRRRERRVLISADHEIQEVAFAAGVSVLSPAAFVRQALEEIEDARDEKADVGDGPWLDMFGGPQSFQLASPESPPPTPVVRQEPSRVVKPKGPLKPPKTDDVASWVAYFEGSPERGSESPKKP